MYFAVFLVALLAGIVPGPDFVVVANNTVAHGKRVGIASALGVGAALTVHAAYSILGLGYLLADRPVLFGAVQLAGAAYLAYLAIGSIMSSFRISADAPVAPGFQGNASAPPEARKSFRTGFRDGLLCNLLNPKAYIFFLSIFSQFMTPTTPKWVEWIYGLEVVLAVAGWFILLAAALSTRAFSRLFARSRKWIERLLGVVLIGFAGNIVVSVIAASIGARGA